MTFSVVCPSFITLQKENQVKLKSSKDIHEHTLFSIKQFHVKKLHTWYLDTSYLCKTCCKTLLHCALNTYTLLMFTVCFGKILLYSNHSQELKFDFQI